MIEIIIYSKVFNTLCPLKICTVFKHNLHFNYKSMIFTFYFNKFPAMKILLHCSHTKIIGGYIIGLVAVTTEVLLF